MTARYKCVFGPGLGKIKEFEARLCFLSETNPKFHKVRPVPYSLRPAGLNPLEKEAVMCSRCHAVRGLPQLGLFPSQVAVYIYFGK